MNDDSYDPFDSPDEQPASDLIDSTSDEDSRDVELPLESTPFVQAPLAAHEPTRASDDAGARGRARARQAQRRRTRQEGDQVTARARQPRQIRPLDRLNLPKITIPVNRALLGVIGGVIFIAVIVIGLGRLRNDPATAFSNAVWIGREWTLEARSPQEVAEFADDLRERQIGSVYAWVSWLQPDQTWNGEASFANLSTFSLAFKTAYPDVRLFGWISLPTEREPGVTRIDDFALQTQVAAFSERIVEEFGFDGVFISADPIWEGDQNYLSLLRTVRAGVGLDTPIGVALPPDWTPAGATIPMPPSIAPGTEWSTPYKQSVGLLVDQMVIMAFQTGMALADDYQAWVAYQVTTYARAIAELDTNIEILIGVPSLPSGTPRLDPAIENIQMTAAGVLTGLAQSGEDARYVVGVAVYAEWETDASEWDSFRRAWLEAR